MKRPGQIIGNLFAVMLAVFSVHAPAETNMAGRDFNHTATGFPLHGVHASAACETCHVAGVFKGTATACDGCHALGKRVVATPKSTSHIVTDAPCDTCHFNASTFLGARFNHGTAVPGQCRNCHNGRQSQGKPASHNTGNKAIKSCDQCHRSFTWFSASWNHIGVAPGTCTNCHIPGGESSYSKPASHTAGTLKGDNQCDDCHGFVAWIPARFKHNTGAACSSCHLNGVRAVGQPSSHSSFVGWPTECNDCHTNTISWSGALGAKPSNHIPYNAGVACSSCHVGTSVTTGPTLHAYVSTFACTTCHLSGTSYLGRMDKKSIGHEGMKSSDDCSKSGCHRPAGSRGTAYIRWD